MIILKTNYDLILFNYEYIDFWKNKRKRIIFNTESEELSLEKIRLEALEKENLNCVWQFCMSRKFIKDNNIKFKKGIKVGEDVTFNLDMLSYKPRIYYLNKCLYWYSYNANSVMNNNSIKNIDNRLKDSTKVYIKNYEYAKKWNMDT